MDYSRDRQIDDSQGGSEALYIFPFVNYNESQIKVVSNYLTVFPSSTIYSFGVRSISFDEDVDGSYDQKLSFQLSKIIDTDLFKNLANTDFRFILKDNNGNLRLLGKATGMQGKFTKSIGTNLSDFNGYNFTYETKEEDTAPFLTDLSLFTISNNLQEFLQYTL